ncbi:MAG: HEAT repeat domain-containing protein [Acidobacteria bacterium]|nr:HEAT repeat domain-containing protein [Acidobacteriota bacterium]
MKRLKSFLNIEPGEGIPVFLLFLYLTLALASFTIARTVRDSLFLDHYSARDLPYAYIAVAVVIGLLVSVYVRLSNRINQALLISGTLLFFIGNVLLLWWLIRLEWAAVAAVFYIWTSIFGIIITAQVWTLAGMALNTRQARRLFPLIGSGGILGGFLGGLLAAWIVRFLGTGNLLFMLVLFPAVCIGIVAVLSKRFCGLCVEDRSLPSGALGKQDKSLRTMLQMTRSSRYLRLIVGLLSISAVATLIIDFQFKVIVQSSFDSADRLAVFFGSFYAWLGLISFLLQIFAGRWIIDHFGIRLTLFALPIALLSGTGILLAFPLQLWSGLLLKGGDGVIRYSIDKSTIELLYMPIPDKLKAEIKAVLDMVVQRISDGLGGLLLLLLTQVLELEVAGTALFNAAILSAWVWTARTTRKEYMSVLRANLSERRIIPEFALKAAFRDDDSLEKIRTMMDGPDEEIVLYAVNLAIAIGRPDLIPASLVRHPSPAVRFRAIDIIPLGKEEFQARLNEEPESAVRAKILARGCSAASTAGSAASPLEHLSSPDIRIRMAAVTCLANSAPAYDMEPVRGYLRRAIGGLEDSSEQWNSIAEMLGDIHHPAVVQLHVRLLHHPDRSVRKKAILAAGRSGHRELVPSLIRLLASRESSGIARKALQEYSGRILGTLADVLMDPGEDIEIRRQVPLILSHIPSQNTVIILIEALSHEDGLLRFRAIRALNRLRINGRDLTFDADAISSHIAMEIEKTLRLMHALDELYRGRESRDLLFQLLKDKIKQGRERVFRLLGLVLPPAAAHAAYRAIVEKDPSRKANAVEYLDNALSPQLRKRVMQLVENGAVGYKEKTAEILENFTQSSDLALRECALDAAVKNHWPMRESQARLERIRP